MSRLVLYGCPSVSRSRRGMTLVEMFAAVSIFLLVSLAASYLLKAGVTCEELGDNAKALTFYKKIKDQYANSPEGYDIDKYITRIENQTK